MFRKLIALLTGRSTRPEEVDVYDVYGKHVVAWNWVSGGIVSENRFLRRAMMVTNVLWALVCALILVTLISELKIGGNHLFAVAVDKAGVPQGPAVPVPLAQGPTQAAILAAQVTFTEDAFAASVDAGVNADNLAKAYDFTGPSTKRWLDAYYGANRGEASPFVLARSHTVGVKVKGVSLVAGSTYQVTFERIVSDFSGRVVERSTRSLLYTISVAPPGGPLDANDPYHIHIDAIQAPVGGQQ